MQQIKVCFINLLAAVAGFLMPIRDFMVAMVMLFIVNFVAGIVADFVAGHGWSWKKAAMFIVYCFIFFGLASFVFTCGHYMHNHDGALQCVSFICWIAMYLYGTNICRNIKSILIEGTPLWRLFDFLYWCLSCQFIEKLPLWNQYVKNRTFNHGKPTMDEHPSGESHGTFTGGRD